MDFNVFRGESIAREAGRGGSQMVCLVTQPPPKEEGYINWTRHRLTLAGKKSRPLDGKK